MCLKAAIVAQLKKINRMINAMGTIAKAISWLRPDKAIGPDELSAKLLIEVQIEIAYP